MRFKSLVPALLLACTSCYKTVEVDLPDQDLHTVFYADTSVDSMVTHLRMSTLITGYRSRYDQSYFEENFPAIRGAEVKITMKDPAASQTQTVILPEISPGRYALPREWKGGWTYSAEVQIPGKDKITSSFTFPHAPDLAVSKKEQDQEDLIGYQLKIKNPSPGKEVLFYFQFLRHTQMIGDFSFDNTYPGGFYSNSVYILNRNPESVVLDGTGEALAYHYGGVFLTTRGGTMDTITMDFYLDENDRKQQQTGPGFVYLVEPQAAVYALPEELFNYYTSIDLQWYNEGDPFAQPSTVYSNVNNAAGIFAVANVRKIPLE